MSPPPHASHLPFAHEPWKTLYVAQRLTTTLLLVPVWVTYYLLVPRSSRPRKSWSIKQIVAVRFTRRVHKVTEMAGVVWGVRDNTKEPKQSSLKETRFQWIDPLPEAFRKGVVNDKEVPCVRVGTFVWPKHPKKLNNGHSSAQRMISLLSIYLYTQGSVPSQGPLLQKRSSQTLGASSSSLADIDLEAMGDVPLVGIFMHGGGYCHMSADEKSPTSKIPRRLTKVRLTRGLAVRLRIRLLIILPDSQDGRFTEIYCMLQVLTHCPPRFHSRGPTYCCAAVEYRLLHQGSFPSATQDAAAVYYHIVKKYGKHICRTAALSF